MKGCRNLLSLKLNNIYLNTCSYSRLSYVHNPGKEPLQQFTLGTLIENAALKYGDKTAIISVEDNRRVSFKEMFEQSTKLAAGFHALGLRKGDTIGLWTPNIIEFIMTLFAAAQAGLITVSLNPVYQKQDLNYCLNKVGIKALICPDSYRNVQFYDTLCNLLPELETSNPGLLRSKAVPTLKSIITVCENTPRGTYNYNEVVDLANEDSVKQIKKMQPYINSDDVTNIQYTSGSTGQPKATCLNHFQMINNGYSVAKRLELDKNDHNICLQVPLFHAFGTNVGVITAQHFGTTLTLPSPLYNSDANLKAIDQEKCTIVYGTPTMYVDLVNLQMTERRNIHLTGAFCGASPCSPELFKDIRHILNITKIHSAYGMTEATAIAFQSLPNEKNQNWDTVGYIGDHLEAKVVDINNNMVPIGTPGQLCIRGYSTMVGYWDDDKHTSEIIGRNKWLKTGDQFVLQENGYGKIVGRIKEIIIRGGENIFPKEIEDVLNTHPEVLENYVIGLSHNRLGEEVCACVRLKAKSNFNYKSMVEFCQDKLTSFKIPSLLKIVDDFPKTASGKIQKHVLKQQFDE